MLLAGEPGIGKTTLSARFAGEVHDDGRVVVYGRCDEDLGIPYQPWIEALTQLVAHVPQPVLDGHVADRGGHLARLVPELARRTGVDVPAGCRERRGAVRAVRLRHRPARAGLGATRRCWWCSTICTGRTGRACSCCATSSTVRPADAGRRARHVPRLRHRQRRIRWPTCSPRCTARAAPMRIALRGLERRATCCDLLETDRRSRDGRRTASRCATRVLAETAGNPFFVGEILRHLAESGAIYQDDDGRWVADTDLRDGRPAGQRARGRRPTPRRLGADTERVLVDWRR